MAENQKAPGMPLACWRVYLCVCLCVCAVLHLRSVSVTEELEVTVLRVVLAG